MFLEKGLLLKDLLIGREYDIRENSVIRNLKKWDIYAARPLLIDGHYLMSRSVYPYSIRVKQRMPDDIMDQYREYREDFPDATMDMTLAPENSVWMPGINQGRFIPSLILMD